MEFTSCSVANVTNHAPFTGVNGGFAHIQYGSHLEIDASNISDVVSTLEHTDENVEEGGALGGVLSIRMGASATVAATRVERCGMRTFNGSQIMGGVFYVYEGSRLTLAQGTVLIDNEATAVVPTRLVGTNRTFGPYGQTIWLQDASTAVYVLPTPPGHWVRGSPCLVNRMPCASDNAACRQVEDACRSVPIAEGAMVDGTPCPAL